jgi:membrane associated rhomboid family serine protease
MEQFFDGTPVSGIIFFLTIATSLYAFSNPQVYGKFMLHPYSVSRGDRIYSIFTSGLIHKDWSHLFFNMFSYFMFAFPLERQIGSVQFATLYIAGLVLSDLPTISKHKDHFWYNSLGASGAISSVLFSYILFFPKNDIGIIFIPIPIDAWLFGILYLVYSVYASKQSDQINHDAHFYGAISGVIITIFFNHGIISSFLNQIMH